LHIIERHDLISAAPVRFSGSAEDSEEPQANACGTEAAGIAAIKTNAICDALHRPESLSEDE
jgi:hypothetical protein